MGGLIIREALQYLENLKDLMHTYISLSSPHLGYAYNSNKIIDVGEHYLFRFMVFIKISTKLIFNRIINE